MNPSDPHDHGSHEAPAAHAPAAAGSPPYFSATEWEAFQIQDKRGAAVIVGLMTSIFFTGLLLYLGVCYAIAW